MSRHKCDRSRRPVAQELLLDISDDEDISDVKDPMSPSKKYEDKINISVSNSTEADEDAELQPQALFIRRKRLPPELEREMQIAPYTPPEADQPEAEIGEIPKDSTESKKDSDIRPVHCPVHLFEAQPHNDEMRQKMGQETLRYVDKEYTAKASGVSSCQSFSVVGKQSSKSMSDQFVPSYTMSVLRIKHQPTLHRAIWKAKFPKIMNYLSLPGNKKKVNKQDVYGRTALHVAAGLGNSEAIKLLLEVPDINVNLTDQDGNTPLFKAVQCSSMACMKELLTADPDTTVPNCKDITALEYVIFKKGDDAFDLFKLLLESGFSTYFMKKGMTLLHLTSIAGNTKMATYIAENALRDFSDEKGRTALMYAAKFDRHAIVEMLLNYGVKADMRDFDGMDALAYAPEMSKTAELLKKYLESPEKFVKENAIAWKRCEAEVLACQTAFGGNPDCLTEEHLKHLEEHPEVTRLKKVVAEISKEQQQRSELMQKATDDKQLLQCQLQDTLKKIESEKQSIRDGSSAMVPVQVNRHTGEMEYALVSDPTRQIYPERKTFMDKVKSIFTKYKRPNRKLTAEEWTKEYEILIAKHNELVAALNQEEEKNSCLRTQTLNLRDAINDVAVERKTLFEQKQKLMSEMNDIQERINSMQGYSDELALHVDSLAATLEESENVAAAKKAEVASIVDKCKKMWVYQCDLKGNLNGLKHESSEKIRKLEEQVKKVKRKVKLHVEGRSN